MNVAVDEPGNQKLFRGESDALRLIINAQLLKISFRVMATCSDLKGGL